MAYFIPSGIQKRLLRYALSKLELLDTDEYDLENLDITLGRTNNVELHDVGLKTDKLASLLRLPPAVRLEVARVLLLKITLQADIWHPTVAVDIQGVRVTVRLDKAQQHAASDKKKRRRSSSSMKDAIPTTQDIAKSFLADEPLQEKRELEDALLSQSRKLQDSDVLSDDDSAGGTGVAMALPSFLANYLQGVQDRLQVSISDVDFEVKAEIESNEIVFGTAKSSEVSIVIHCDTLGLEGITTGDAAKSAENEERTGKRHVNIQQFTVDLISDTSMFADLSRAPSVTSRSPSQPRSPKLSRSSGSRSDPRSLPTSPPSGRSETRARRKSLDPSDVGSLGFSRRLHRRGSLEALLRQRSAMSDSERFADASDDGLTSSLRSKPSISHAAVPMAVPARSPHAQGTIYSQSGKDLAEYSTEEDLALSHYTDQDDLLQASFDDLPVGSDAFNHRKHEIFETQVRPQLRRGPLSATFPNVRPPASGQSEGRSDNRSVSRSQPNVGRVHNEPLAQQPLVDPLAPVHPTHTERSPSPASGSSAGSSSAGGGELAESKLFTHEDAESMYMSALSEVPVGQSRNIVIPGGWDRSIEMPQTDSTEADPVPSSYGGPPDVFDDEGGATPRAASPALPADRPQSPVSPKTGMHVSSPVAEPDPAPALIGSPHRAAKRLFSVANVNIWVPPTQQESESKGRQSVLEPSLQQERLSSMYRATPGSFSVYGASQYLDPSVMAQSTAGLATPNSNLTDTTAVTPDSSIEVAVGSVEMNLDMSVTRAALQILGQVQEVRKQVDSSEQSASEAQENKSAGGMPLFRLLLEQLTVRFVERIAISPMNTGDNTTKAHTPTNGSLFYLDLHGVDLQSLDNNELRTSIRKFILGCDNEQILSFENEDAPSATKTQQSPSGIVCVYRRSPHDAEVSLTIQPVRLNIDIQRIDETLSCFGGLSGVLELSSSISSSSQPLSSPVQIVPQRSRGVRFAGEPEVPATTPLTGLKINAHLRGLSFLLTGQACGLSLETTGIRIAGRERGISTSFSQLRFAGPYFDASDTIPPLNVRLEGTRIDFLFAPEEQDLTKLVSLITPSRDKYDDDDDILLDTLLRQRQKGSLIRVNANVFRLDLTDLSAVHKLQCLGDELAKIQNVAKYLPEDDRPGMLTMLTLRDVRAKVPIDNALGTLQLDAQGFRLGHVGIPPLLATSIDTISLTHGHGVQLVNEVLHQEVVDLPMLMVRIISDEMIPTVKVKLHNMCVEYRVPTVLALMGLHPGATAEDLSASIATSVATVTRQASHVVLEPVPAKRAVGSRKSTSKSVHVEVLFRECGFGLNPQSSPSKAILLLSDAKFHSEIPTDTTYAANLEARKAYILLVDDVINIAKSADASARSTISVTGSKHVLELCRAGYVPIATISKAQLSFRSWEDEDQMRLTEVNVKNELFVMESCADSTQTLISLLGALAPPSPPNMSERYRTKVMPMEDMMASFSGEPVAEAQQDINVDVEEDDDDFDLPVDMIGSFYTPDEPEDDLEAEVQEIQEIPRVDELGELKSAPISGGADRAALLELGERCRISAREDPFVYENDFYARQAGNKSMAREWNSTKNEYGIASAAKVAKSPLTAHLYDLHFIWNLFDGYDWAKTRQTIEKAVHEVETKAEDRRREKRLAPDEDDDKEEVIGDFLFNSIWIEVPANKDPRELARNINRDVDDLASETGSYATMTTHTNSPTRSAAPRPRRKRLRLQRSKHRKITFELRNVAADVYVYPPDSGETQSSIDVRIGDLEVFDHVPSSTWKKFATYMKDAGEREMGKPMIRLELLDVKPVEGLAASEAVLRVSVLPLRLHVDQDALDFITRFFEFKDDSAKAAAPSGPAPFIQRIEVRTVYIKLDYKPKKVDYAGIRSGHTTEFMNFFILDDCDIVLRHCIIYGVSGFDKLHKTLNDIWMPDVKRNQLPTVLAGLAPVRPLVNVTSGVRDLVYIPLREYRKDGRIVRSVQKGAVAFARTTTSELARLGAKIAIGTQNVLQGAEDMLAPSPSGTTRRRDDAEWDDTSYPFSTSPGHAPDDSEERRATSNYADQPIGVVAGLRSAARSLERDLLTARDAIVAIPGEVMESESAGEAVGVVARRAPTVILRTARGASKAVGVALLGAGNALDADSRRRIEEKYKRY